MTSSTVLAERYGVPPRGRRRALVALVAVVALAGIVWVGWTVTVHSRPQVTSQMVGYDVHGEHAITATWTVVRRDTDVRASCLLQALSDDHSVVGEVTVPVDSGPATRQIRSTLRTERRAGTVQLVGCTTQAQQSPE